MEKTNWNIEGMTCTNCALTISRFLEKNGISGIHVNPISGELSFETSDTEKLPELKKGIEALGYGVKMPGQSAVEKKKLLGDNKSRFLFTLPFTAVLMLHMLDSWIHIHWLMDPFVQLALCLPVFITGMYFFGRSAWKSMKNGIPNMNTLITIGALASFIYSLTGLIMQLGSDYLFFETTATIITLVFLGNYLEDASVSSTQSALKKLATSQKVMANMIAFNDQHREQVFPIDNAQLKTGDLVLIRSGEKVPADCKILWGECEVNESIITGESLPLHKVIKDKLIGGSLLETGTVKAQVTAAGNHTILAGILQMVRMAQSEKPPVQKLADRISAIFVPVVIGLAIIAFLMNYFLLDAGTGQSLMRSVAVLVIACPCAMGLATPAGIAVGLGRAARSGILFRKPAALESFNKITRVVFDKTGTLTTGKFSIERYETTMKDEEFRKIVTSLEKYSTHPLAKAIINEWPMNDSIRWKKIEEIKGYGVKAEDSNGNIYSAGSKRMLNGEHADDDHDMFISCNDKVIGRIRLKDEIRPEAAEVINKIRQAGIRTYLLSGDKKEKCEATAKELGIDEVFAEQLPEEKLKKIAALSANNPTAMVGDGINDAPALAKATLGISLSEASDIAMQNADVVLMNNGLKHLPLAMGLGKHTYITIKQNLFWAFFYNIIAIPVAAMGWLTPAVAALAMGFSDVILAANSVRLFVKKVD